jgi:alkylation response protein AidB-like acyl-CoA dehydrogenase
VRAAHSLAVRHGADTDLAACDHDAMVDDWPPATLVPLIASIAARAAEHDRDGSFPAEAFAPLAATGALRLTIPIADGGLGRGLAASTELVVRLGAADPAVALVVAQHLLNHALLDATVWPDELRRMVRRSSVEGVGLINALRVEPELGTPARGGLPATVAVRLPTGWRLSGRKIYCTGIPLLRWMLVWARTDDPDPAIGSFLVEAGTPGYQVARTWNTLGMRATRSDDVVFDGVEVPLERAIGVTAEPARPAEAIMSWNAVMMAAVYHGVARAARDWLVGYLNERAPANLGAPLATLPRVQEAVGRIEVAIATGDQLLAGIAGDVDRGEPGAAGRAAMAKHVVTNAAIDVVLDAVRLTGNPGLSKDHPLERHLRDVLHGRIHTPQDDTILVGAGRGALDAIRPTAG